MYKKLTSIPEFFRSVLQTLRVRQYILWFLISGLVFTIISRLLVIIPPLLYIAMQSTGETLLYGILMVLSMLVAWYVIVISFSLFLLVSRRIALGQNIMVKTSLREAHHAVGRTTITIVLFGLFVLFGALLLIIPGIVIAILCFFAPTIAVLGENKTHPFRQSKLLYKGRFWAVMLRLIIIYAFTMAPMYALSFVHPVASQAWGITTSFFSFLFTKIYLDLERVQA